MQALTCRTSRSEGATPPIAWAGPCQCTSIPPGPLRSDITHSCQKPPIPGPSLISICAGRNDLSKIRFPISAAPTSAFAGFSCVTGVSCDRERGGSSWEHKHTDLHGPLPAGCVKKRAQGIRCALEREIADRRCKFDRGVDRQKAHVCPRAATYQSSELIGRAQIRNPLGVAASRLAARPLPPAQTLAFQAGRRPHPRHVAELGKVRRTWCKLKIGWGEKKVRVPALTTSVSPIIPYEVRGSLNLALFPRNNDTGNDPHPPPTHGGSFCKAWNVARTPSRIISPRGEVAHMSSMRQWERHVPW